MIENLMNAAQILLALSFVMMVLSRADRSIRLYAALSLIPFYATAAFIILNF